MTVITTPATRPRSVPGLAKSRVRHVADTIVAEGLATVEPNPDHQRSSLLILISAGQGSLTRSPTAAASPRSGVSFGSDNSGADASPSWLPLPRCTALGGHAVLDDPLALIDQIRGAP